MLNPSHRTVLLVPKTLGFIVMRDILKENEP